jgi:hypothetical protein
VVHHEAEFSSVQVEWSAVCAMINDGVAFMRQVLGFHREIPDGAAVKDCSRQIGNFDSLRLKDESEESKE